MARVSVSEDCSPFGVGLPISLAGIEGMMCFLASRRVRTVSPAALLESECCFPHVDCCIGRREMMKKKRCSPNPQVHVMVTLVVDSFLWRNGWSKLSLMASLPRFYSISLLASISHSGL